MTALALLIAAGLFRSPAAARQAGPGLKEYNSYLASLAARPPQRARGSGPAGLKVGE
jgi:hypothetical protein